jgi:hypothetical protein
LTYFGRAENFSILRTFFFLLMRLHWAFWYGEHPYTNTGVEMPKIFRIWWCIFRDLKSIKLSVGGAQVSWICLTGKFTLSVLRMSGRPDS